jgi:hypothetical protein
MLLVRSHGQMGNQIFHLLGALSVLRTNERLVLFGFGELLELLPELKFDHIVVPIPNRFARNVKFLERGLRRLARRGVIGRANYSEESAELTRTDGRFSPTLFDAGNAQNYSVINLGVLQDFFIRVDRDLVETQGGPLKLNESLNCFVHIRRGDYLAHPSVEESIAIPDSWFLEQMIRIANDYPEVEFFLYSDSIDALADEIVRFPNTRIRDVSHIVAFHEMALADMGILSASTFSWWSAMVANYRGARGPFIGPQHWAGWRKGAWDPEGFVSDAITYVDVAR